MSLAIGRRTWVMESALREAQLGKVLADKHMPHKNKLIVWKYKDLPFEWISAALLKSVSSDTDYIIPEHTPVSNQGGVGTCVANAVMDAYEMLLPPDDVVQLSRLFAYWISRALHKDTDNDDGTYIRSCFQQLKNVGAIEEKYMPYQASFDAVTTAPSLDLYTMASNNRITGFYKIVAQGVDKIDQLELVIRAGHPPVFAMDVNRAFTRFQGDLVWSYMSDPIGGHAMILTGVRRRYGRREFLVRNSWGPQWGEQGHCWMAQGLIQDQARDIWVATKLEEII